MSKRERLESTGREPCPVCHDEVTIHAIGQCDHSICFKCSTRMRVLCDQQYCAICRTDLPKVLFVKEYRKFQQISTQSFQIFRKNKIWFQNESIQTAFYDLISHRCKFCSGTKPFRTFHQLEQHMRREHGVHYCDICVANLKVFSIERKCYDRELLARHRRMGDEDDKSFKGHPLCELCDQRFLDRDELAKHCRKEHFRCHFCETDGKLLEFFGDYSLLRDHFLHEHYLCEEGECYNVQFTNAFRSDIDLKAHKAQQHSRGMKKSEARQARTLELDIHLAPRGSHGRARPPRDRGGADAVDSGRHQDREREQKRTYARQQREEVQAAHAIAASLNHISRNSGAVAVVDSALINHVAMETAQQQRPDSQQFEKQRDDFPTLHGNRLDSDEGIRRNNSSGTLAKKVALANNFSVQDGNMEVNDFPQLASKGKVRTASANNRGWNSAPNDADFPSLSSPKTKRHEKAPPKNSNKSWVKTASQPAPKPVTQPVLAPSWSQSSNNKPAPGPSWNQPKTSERNSHLSSFTRAEDYPSLSSIGNSLIPATNQPPAPKLSMFKSSQSASAGAKPTVNATPTQQIKAAPKGFDKKDFPTLGSNTKEKPSSGSQWVAKKEKEPEVPKDKKQKTNKDKSEMKVLSKEPEPAPRTPTTAVKIDFEPPKPNLRDTQANALEKLVAQQTKNKKKKNKKGKKSPDNAGSQSADVSDKESDREEPKPKQNRSASVSKVEAEVVEKQALQPKMDNFPSLSELSESIPTAVPSVPAPQFDKEEFPTLGSSSKKAPPPGFVGQNSSQPPPGFVSSKSSSSTSNGPPPGFNGSQRDNIENVAPKAKKSNGTVLTYTYVPPANSKDRNRKLIQEVQEMLSSEQFSNFKTFSGEFRQSQITGREYYHICCQIMGNQAFEKIFPELLVLLPDINKQQVLLSAHNSASEDQDIIKISKSGKRGWKSAGNFTSCPTCQQVISRSDLTSHSSEHDLDSDFPTLGNIASTLGTWGKK